MTSSVPSSQGQPTNTVVYTCAHCRETFESDWSDEEAQAEAAHNFGVITNPVVVCDDCFHAMRRWHGDE